MNNNQNIEQLFSFDELSYYAQQKAKECFCNFNRDYWNDHQAEELPDIIGEHLLKKYNLVLNKPVEFSFNGNFVDWVKISGKITDFSKYIKRYTLLKSFTNDTYSSQYKLLYDAIFNNEVDEIIISNKTNHSASLGTSGISHHATIFFNVNNELEDENTESIDDEYQEKLESLVEDFLENHVLFDCESLIRKSFEDLCSDDNFQKWVESEELVFTEEGMPSYEHGK